MSESSSPSEPSQRYVSQAEDLARIAWCDGQRPEPNLTVSEWADENRYLSQKAASEPRRWRIERTPYLACRLLQRRSITGLNPAIRSAVLIEGERLGTGWPAMTQPLGAILIILVIWLYAYDRGKGLVPGSEEWGCYCCSGVLSHCDFSLACPYSPRPLWAFLPVIWPGLLNWRAGLFPIEGGDRSYGD